MVVPVTEVYKNIYSFSVILPKSPLREINAYVIKTPEKAFLFDTGYNDPESKAALLNGLKEIELTIEDVDLYLTHLHSDHVGLAPLFDEAGCRIYAGRIDGEHMNNMANGKYWALLDSFRELYDLENEISLEDNPGYQYRMTKEINYHVLEIGDRIEIGDYQFEVVDLKGHTPGHIGFYDAKHKIMLSGDTVLDPITPNITYWGESFPNSLAQYIDTLLMLKSLEIDYLFATHRKIIDNHQERIDQLIHHHHERLQEILDALSTDATYTIRDISAKISWRIKADSWETFPRPQKWFASGETMAHVDYLVNLGYLSMTNENGVLTFKKLRDHFEPVYPN